MAASMSEHPPFRESGQAAVESALVLPLMVFLCLGFIQLTLMQQARLMTGYAAFCAARAGIVWNGHHERMQDAALLALLPTLGRTDGLAGLAGTWARARLDDEALRRLAWPTRDAPVPDAVNGSWLFGRVRVDTVSPSGDAPRWAPSWEELDFDGPGTSSRAPERASEPARLPEPPPSDVAEAAYREATVLSVRVRYWYELRVPFADWVLFTTWWATRAGASLGGAIDRPSVDARASLTHARGGMHEVGALPARGMEHQRGYSTLYAAEMAVLWGLATGSIPLAGGVGPHYLIPLTATYSMRMQSNFHAKWRMHPSLDGGR